MNLRTGLTRLGLAVWLLLPSVLWANGYAGHTEYPAFAEKMVSEHGFERAWLDRLFAQAERKDSILEAIARPAERVLTWAEYRRIFVNPQRIAGGVDFWERNRNALANAERVYQVPARVLVAIIGVETRYGSNMGSYRVLDALATLGFDYPPRAKFFLGQLEEYLLLTREQGFDPHYLKGSYAGAMGLGQFIPSSYRAYAVDFDHSGQADIWSNPMDAIGSVANYFREHGWRSGEAVAERARLTQPVDDSVTNGSLKPKLTLAALQQAGFDLNDPAAPGETFTAMKLDGEQGDEYWIGHHNFYVITRYNHSHMYAMAVYQLSEAIAAALEAN